MWTHFILFLGFLSLIYGSSTAGSLVGGSSNRNFHEYLQFLSDTLSNDDPDAFQIVKSHIETDLFSVAAHNRILTRFLQAYFKQLNTFPTKESINEESLGEYLRYVLKRNFDKLPGFEHRLMVIKTFNDDFSPIALLLIQLKNLNFNEMFFREMTKDLSEKSKFFILKEVIKICDGLLSSKVFLLMIQGYIIACADTFWAVKSYSNLHKDLICTNWEKEVYMIPIHFALTRVDPDLEVTRNILTGFQQQSSSKFKQKEIVSILSKILNLTKFLSKTKILTVEEVEKRCEIVDLILLAIFPVDKALVEILSDLVRYDEILVFETILNYKRFTITEVEFKGLLDYIILCSASRLSEILNTSIAFGIKIEDFLTSFNLEILILIMSFAPPFEVAEEAEGIPGTSPMAIRVVLEIARQLETILYTFPELKLSLQVPEDQSEFIYLPEPLINNQIDPLSSDLFDRFPVFIYAARIFLFKTFSIPLAVTRYLDTANESVTWSEAVAYINFYIERFSRISGIERYYKVIEA